MSPAERLVLAHQIAAEGAARLHDGNDPASGVRLLLRAAATDLTAFAGPVCAADYLTTLAREAFETEAPV